MFAFGAVFDDSWLYLQGGDYSSFNQQAFAAARFTKYYENFTRRRQNVRTENGVEYGETWQATLSASHEVLWSATGSPEWEHIEAVGKVTKATLPVSKDNVIFAVRASDEQKTQEFGRSSGAGTID